jgi:anion-transporting  ArsA/GET3 family ATPase
MSSLLEHKLIVVTGKGGAGKTTIACALGVLAAHRGLRTIVAELSDQHRLPALFGHSNSPDAGAEVELETNLWSASIDPNQALIEWLRTLGGGISVRLLAASSTFHYFTAAAPGAKELVSMMRVRELCEGHTKGASAASQSRRHGPAAGSRYELVILDAPATGHALALLRSPQTFATIVRSGPLATQAQAVRELLADPRRTAYVGVTQGAEMAIAETLELEEGLRRHLDRDLDAIVVNGTVPRRFTGEELERISTATADDAPVVRSARRMARAVGVRARLQRNQIGRLRRQRFAEGMPPSVLTIPLAFTRELDLAYVREIAGLLERKL